MTTTTRRTLSRRLAAGLAAGLITIAFAAATPGVAFADRTVAVFFRGFGATPGASGMDALEDALASAFGGRPGRPFSSQVYAYTELQAAFDFIDGFTDVDCLILVGHSFGGDAAVELAASFLGPAGIPVDLLIQLDSVGLGDEVLPPGVAQGFNYYQISTGLFEPQGETFVEGASNFQVETLYGVTNSDITHTTIDCPQFDYSDTAYAALFGSQPDLYARIEDHLAAVCGVAVPALGARGALLLATILTMTSRRLASPKP